MKKQKFRELMRTNRGKLTGMDDSLDYIVQNGELTFVYMMINQKVIGIDKSVDIVSRLDMKEQSELVKWMHGKKKTISEIDLKVASIEAAR